MMFKNNPMSEQTKHVQSFTFIPIKVSVEELRVLQIGFASLWLSIKHDNELNSKLRDLIIYKPVHWFHPPTHFYEITFEAIFMRCNSLELNCKDISLGHFLDRLVTIKSNKSESFWRTAKKGLPL